MSEYPSWMDDMPLLPSLDVPEHQPVKTGIVDKYGTPIVRHPRPVGFHKPGKPRG